MIAAEIKVNGVLIGFLYLRNTKETGIYERDYSLEYYKPDFGDVYKSNIVGFDPRDGAENLMAIAMKEIAEKGGSQQQGL